MSQTNFQQKYGPWGIVLGGSEGIGACFAEKLASEGINVIIVARRVEPLEKEAKLLKEQYGVEVKTLSLDLSSTEAFAKIKSFTQNIEIGFLAYNACVPSLGSYLDISEERHEAVLAVNSVLVHRVTYYFSKLMRERQRGGILLVSSMACLNGSPYNAQYAATKAYIRNLGESLWYELKEFNIDVNALIVSQVSTPAFIRSGSTGSSKNGSILTPQECSDEAFNALGKHPSWITGRKNRMLAWFMDNMLPQKIVLEFIAKSIRENFTE